MNFPISEIKSFCSPTSYYRELAVSKKKKNNYRYILSTLDLFFEAEYTSTSVRLRTYFSLNCQLQTDSIRLFMECLPHKRMLFSAPQLHVHINISFVFARLIWYSCTDVNTALNFSSKFSHSNLFFWFL